MTTPDDPNTIPTVPPAPSQSSVPVAVVPGERPFWRRTWVRITGAALAAVILLGAGFGIGRAASAGDDHGFSSTQGRDGGQPGGPLPGGPGHDGSGRPGDDDRRGDHQRDDGSTEDDDDSPVPTPSPSATS